MGATLEDISGKIFDYVIIGIFIPLIFINIIYPKYNLQVEG